MVFWDQIFEEVDKEYPDVKIHSYLVDAASMFMIKYIEDVLTEKTVLTPDLGGKSTTQEVGDAIVRKMSEDL